MQHGLLGIVRTSIPLYRCSMLQLECELRSQLCFPCLWAGIPRVIKVAER